MELRRWLLVGACTSRALDRYEDWAYGSIFLHGPLQPNTARTSPELYVCTASKTGAIWLDYLEQWKAWAREMLCMRFVAVRPARWVGSQKTAGIQSI
jgi:hypothetical protein